MKAILDVHGWTKVINISGSVLRCGVVEVYIPKPLSLMCAENSTPDNLEPCDTFRLYRIDTGNETPRFTVDG